jgi:cell volume regulation protein A
LPVRVKRQTHTDLELADTIKSEFVEIQLPHNSNAIGKPIVQLGFPKTALIALIKREGKFITPNGSTILNEGDRLLIVSESKSSLKIVYEVLGIKQDAD